MKKIISLLVMICVGISLSSCATLFKGTVEDVNFGSNPGGAEVWVDGRFMGRTPLNFKLSSNKSYVIEFKYAGQIKSVNLTAQVGAGWVILDILAGLIPVIIDAATGAWYSFDENNVNVDFGTPIYSENIRPPNETMIPAQTIMKRKVSLSANEIITAKISNKISEKEGYKENIWFDIEWIPAKLKKPARIISGILEFYDLRGNIGFKLEKTFESIVYPTVPIKETEIGFTFDQSNDAHTWMKGTDIKYMILKFRVKNILYEDGEREDF